jgi:hypothetical protein
MDCLFSRITNIHPHPNADKLDLGLVNNWPVIVPKGSFIENEIEFEQLSLEENIPMVFL